MTPSLDQLHKRARGVVESQLHDGEEVIAVFAGRSRQAMIVTNRQVLIVKPGVMAGAALGAKLGSFPLASITAINVHTGRGVAALEIVANDHETPEKADLRAAYQLLNWLPCPASLGTSPLIGELRAYVLSGGRARSARAELIGAETP